MQSPDSLKQIVRDRYDEIVRSTGRPGCCGTATEQAAHYATFSEAYSGIDGYTPDADLGLGCGIPTEHAEIREGDTVLDLGAGAGNDVFVARSLAGDTGKVIGVDFTPSMVEKAESNRATLGYENVSFRFGDIEALPVDDNSVDVVISNCVLNLVPDKAKAFGEIYRVLKPGAHFCVSDIILQGEIPAPLREAAEMYAGCVSGAVPLRDYLSIIETTGFSDVEVVKDRRISIPPELLSEYLRADELDEVRSSGAGLRSVTVKARKSVR